MLDDTQWPSFESNNLTHLSALFECIIRESCLVICLSFMG